MRTEGAARRHQLARRRLALSSSVHRSQRRMSPNRVTPQGATAQVLAFLAGDAPHDDLCAPLPLPSPSSSSNKGRQLTHALLCLVHATVQPRSPPSLRPATRPSTSSSPASSTSSSPLSPSSTHTPAPIRSASPPCSPTASLPSSRAMSTAPQPSPTCGSTPSGSSTRSSTPASTWPSRALLPPTRRTPCSSTIRRAHPRPRPPPPLQQQSAQSSSPPRSSTRAPGSPTSARPSPCVHRSLSLFLSSR